MYASSIWAVVLWASAAQAFQDTSPFFLFSTSELLSPGQNIISASSLSKSINPQLEKCPSDTYVIVSQPKVNAADYAISSATPHLRAMMRGDEQTIRSSHTVRDVYGTLDAQAMSKTVEEKCNAGHLKIDASTGSFTLNEEARPQVITVDFPPLPEDESRVMKLAENDAFLASLLAMLPTERYTVLYTTTPRTASSADSASSKYSSTKETQQTKSISESYHLEDDLFQSPVHMELKRDFSPRADEEDGDDVDLPDGPLFERYTFLSPGLFEGILVTIILLSILYVGMTGVGSLQVTYAAFDREMGPAAQAKKQQ